MHNENLFDFIIFQQNKNASASTSTWYLLYRRETVLQVQEVVRHWKRYDITNVGVTTCQQRTARTIGYYLGVPIGNRSIIFLISYSFGILQ